MKLGSHWKTIDDKKISIFLKYVNKCNIEKNKGGKVNARVWVQEVFYLLNQHSLSSGVHF